MKCRWAVNLMMDSLQKLLHKKVEVSYQGICYYGILAFTGEDEVYLQTTTDWVTLPMSGISDIREVLK
jgi:hypothetical protein